MQQKNYSLMEMFQKDKVGIMINHGILFCFCILIFFLPIAHTATIRSFTIFTPLILIIIRYYFLRDIRFINTSFELPFLAFFITALISLFTSIDLHESVKEIWGELIIPILVFYSVYLTIKKEKEAFLLIKILFFSSFIFSAYSFYDFYVHKGHFFSAVYRAGGLRDPGGGEVAALYHCMVIPFIIFSIFYSQVFKNHIFLSCLLLINFLAFHLTFVRAGMIAIIFQILFVSLLLLLDKKWKMSLILLIIIVSIGTLYMEKKMFREMHTEKIPSLTEYFKLTPEEIAGKNPSSMRQRLAMWKTAIDKISENPFYPHGYGRFLFGKTVRNENNRHFIYPQTHNTFIGIAFELGIQGFLVFLWMIGTFFIVCLKYWVKSNNCSIKFFSGSLMTMMIGYWVNNFFGSFDGDDTKLLFMVLLGIGMAVMHKIPKEIGMVRKND